MRYCEQCGTPNGACGCGAFNRERPSTPIGTRPSAATVEGPRISDPAEHPLPVVNRDDFDAPPFFRDAEGNLCVALGRPRTVQPKTLETCDAQAVIAYDPAGDLPSRTVVILPDGSRINVECDYKAVQGRIEAVLKAADDASQAILAAFAKVHVGQAPAFYDSAQWQALAKTLAQLQTPPTPPPVDRYANRAARRRQKSKAGGKGHPAPRGRGRDWGPRKGKR